MPRTITLVRHGRSAHVHTGWLDFDGFLRWRESYELAPIADDDLPPRELCTLAENAAIVASNAPRAITSAQRLAPDREVTISPLLRELELPPPRMFNLRLPPLVWALAFLLRGLRPSGEEAQRAAEAAKLLDTLAREKGSVVAATHGAVRPAIARELVRLGWAHDGGRRGTHHWSAWTLTMPAA
ncbi:MAG TPA: hypothetical protein VNI54_08640 [Thermoanaerobaculia bacterium]|nr:hypothetical protein [Thermoanaerobaculia bacterium]